MCDGGGVSDGGERWCVTAGGGVKLELLVGERVANAAVRGELPTAVGSLGRYSVPSRLVLLCGCPFLPTRVKRFRPSLDGAAVIADVAAGRADCRLVQNTHPPR